MHRTGYHSTLCGLRRFTTASSNSARGGSQVTAHRGQHPDQTTSVCCNTRPVSRIRQTTGRPADRFSSPAAAASAQIRSMPVQRFGGHARRYQKTDGHALSDGRAWRLHHDPLRPSGNGTTRGHCQPSRRADRRPPPIPRSVAPFIRELIPGWTDITIVCPRCPTSGTLGTNYGCQATAEWLESVDSDLFSLAVHYLIGEARRALASTKGGQMHRTLSSDAAVCSTRSSHLAAGSSRGGDEATRRPGAGFSCAAVAGRAPWPAPRSIRRPERTAAAPADVGQPRTYTVSSRTGDGSLPDRCCAASARTGLAR